MSVTNLGLVTVSSLQVGNGSALTLHGGDTVSNLLSLGAGSTLTVQEANGTGLTFMGSSASDLTISGSTMDLVFNATSPNDWDFRWQDPFDRRQLGQHDQRPDRRPRDHALPAPRRDVSGRRFGRLHVHRRDPAVGRAEPSALVLAGIATAGVFLGMRARCRVAR